MLLQQVCPAKLKHNKKGKNLVKKRVFFGGVCLWMFEADMGVRFYTTLGGIGGLLHRAPPYSSTLLSRSSNLISIAASLVFIAVIFVSIAVRSVSIAV